MALDGNTVRNPCKTSRYMTLSLFRDFVTKQVLKGNMMLFRERFQKHSETWKTSLRAFQYFLIILLGMVGIIFLSLPVPSARAISPAGQWIITPVDNTGIVGWDSSIGVDRDGKVHISYYDATNGDLKHAIIAPSGVMVTEVVDGAGGDVGWYTSIGIDSAGKVHIGYFDVDNGDLKYATNATGSWVNEVVDGSSGQVGKYLSLALDKADRVYMSYYDSDNGDLKYATNSSGSWVIETVDTFGTVGWYTSIGIDSSGHAHISYYYVNGGNLKYATNSSGSWVTETVDSGGDVGWDTAIGIGPSGDVHIAYYDATNGDLKHAYKSGGTWVTEVVDSSGDVGLYASIFVDDRGAVHISYYDSTNKYLKYATNRSGSWVTETVDSDNAGAFTAITGDLPGNIQISYYDNGNGSLKHAIKGAGYDLKRGFNLISAFTNTGDVPDAYTLLDLTDGNGNRIESVRRYDRVNGVVQEAHVNPDGTIGGDNFPIVPGEGLVVYAPVDMNIDVLQRACALFDLQKGINWSGTPCRPDRETAFSLLQALGEANVISIQRFNPSSGRFETAGFLNGQIVGVDFPLEARGGYFIYMKNPLSGFRP